MNRGAPMPKNQSIWLTRLATLAVAGAVVLIAPAAPTSAQQVPSVPDPVPVVLDPATTALFVMDVTDSICAAQPNCVEMVPRVADLVNRARAAGVFIAYTEGTNPGHPLPEVAPAPGDPIVVGGQNKFLGTMLDDHLRQRGIKTIILTGWRANG